MHSDEQRIMTADSTESLIRFCKEIGPAIAIAGKINRRHSSNWPVTSGCSRYFTGDCVRLLENQISKLAVVPGKRSWDDGSDRTRRDVHHQRQQGGVEHERDDAVHGRG